MTLPPGAQGFEPGRPSGEEAYGGIINISNDLPAGYQYPWSDSSYSPPRVTGPELVGPAARDSETVPVRPTTRTNPDASIIFRNHIDYADPRPEPTGHFISGLPIITGDRGHMPPIEPSWYVPEPGEGDPFAVTSNAWPSILGVERLPGLSEDDLALHRLWGTRQIELLGALIGDGTETDPPELLIISPTYEGGGQAMLDSARREVAFALGLAPDDPETADEYRRFIAGDDGSTTTRQEELGEQ